jgi:glycosyltransferase involved in cell wall biosynthesis
VIRGFGDKIIAIFQPNQTQRVACNTGFARSTGEIICFLDSDDMLDPSVASEIAAVWRNGISKAQFQMMRIDAAGQPLGSVFPAYNPMPTPEKIRDWTRTTSAYPTAPGSGNFYARTFLQKLFPIEHSCGDFSDSACLAAAPFLGDVVTIAKPLVFYRVHGNNDSKLSKDETRFAREISRAQARIAYARRIAGENPDDSQGLIFKSLEVLQFRVASLRLRPDLHPLPDDNRVRAFIDAVRVPLLCPSSALKVRLLAAIWCVLTLNSPKLLARKLIKFRYK